MGAKTITRMYSVYRAKDEMPIMLYAMAKACAAALGIRVDSFYRAVARSKACEHEPRDYIVYEDEVEELEDVKGENDRDE